VVFVGDRGEAVATSHSMPRVGMRGQNIIGAVFEMSNTDRARMGSTSGRHRSTVAKTRLGLRMCATAQRPATMRRTVELDSRYPQENTMDGWFDVNKSKAEDFYFVLKAGNGEVVLTSEMYKSKESANGGIASVQLNASHEGSFERSTATDGKFRFNLKSPNHQVIGTSQLYTTEGARDAGITSVKHNGKSRTIKDNT
jgi:uncharacterized protein YegP (UPF0339 family)